MMAYYSDVVQDRQGNAVSGVAVAVYLENTVTPATLTDNDSNPLANPVTTDADGVFEFNVAPGTYDCNASKPGVVDKDFTIIVQPEAVGLGVHTIWIPAAAMISSTTDGATYAVREMATNKNNYGTMEFDQATQQYAEFSVGMPDSWDEGTLTASFTLMHAAATSFGIRLGIQAIARGDGETADVAFTAAQSLTYNGGSTNDMHITGTTAAFSAGTGIVAKDLVHFRVFRDVGHEDDTMDATVQLLGVSLFYTVSGATDA